MCDCGNELNLCKLHVKKEKAEHISAHRIDAAELCATKLDAGTINAQDEVVNNLCASGMVQASQMSALNFNTNTLCAQQGTINTLCVDNLTVSKPVPSAVKYRAATTNAANSTYTLGQPVDWNTVLDDPNSNVALGPFTYTVPASGYYLVTFHLESDSLQGTATISGVPIGLLTLLSNNAQLRQMQAPFLSFSNAQSSSFTTLSLLNVGDIITMSYNVLVFDQVSGLIPYVGTINIKANGLFPGSSGFGIHYLSSLTQGPTPPPASCIVCPPVQIGCTPVTVRCSDCIPATGQPCHAGM